MATPTMRAEPRPFEEIIIASTLESAKGQEVLMETIHRLSQERSMLQIRLARHPWSDREAARRIHDITAELDTRWAEVRRNRAARRVQLETALGIDPAITEQKKRQQADSEAVLSARKHSKRQVQVMLAQAS